MEVYRTFDTLGVRDIGPTPSQEVRDVTTTQRTTFPPVDFVHSYCGIRIVCNLDVETHHCGGRIRSSPGD